MKKLFIVLAMGALVATGAFAQLTFGITGVQYFSEDANGDLPSVSDAWKNLQDGTGVYYGGFVEIIGRNMGLGLSFNYVPDPSPFATFDMMDYDVNIYLSYHLFGGRAFLDPFLTLGVGMRAYDYKDKEKAIDTIDPYGNGQMFINEESPLYASPYWDAGLGLGINLGPLGIFVKGVYNMNIDGAIKGTAGPDGYVAWDSNGNMIYSVAPNQDFDVLPWLVSPFKWVFGAKLIL